MPAPGDRAVSHDGVEYVFSSDWIHRLESRSHWMQYWHQADLVRTALPGGGTVIEVGVGTGFLAAYLRTKGFQVLTVDIDESKSPDVVANLAEYSCDVGADALLAFEVFEHLPLGVGLAFLERSSRNIRGPIVMSVPWNARRRLLELAITLPRVGRKSVAIELPFRRPRAEHHFWELGDGEHGLGEIAASMAAASSRQCVIERRVDALQYLVLE